MTVATRRPPTPSEGVHRTKQHLYYFNGAGPWPGVTTVTDVLDKPALTYWKRDDIPPAVFLIMRDLVALEVRSAFGQPVNASGKEAEEMIILKRLRRHTSVKSSGLPVRAVYY